LANRRGEGEEQPDARGDVRRHVPHLRVGVLVSTITLLVSAMDILVSTILQLVSTTIILVSIIIQLGEGEEQPAARRDVRRHLPHLTFEYFVSTIMQLVSIMIR